MKSSITIFPPLLHIDHFIAAYWCGYSTGVDDSLGRYPNLVMLTQLTDCWAVEGCTLTFFTVPEYKSSKETDSG